MTKVEAPFRALEFQFAAPEMLIDLQAIGSQFSVGSPTQLDKIKNLHTEVKAGAVTQLQESRALAVMITTVVPDHHALGEDDIGLLQRGLEANLPIPVGPDPWSGVSLVDVGGLHDVPEPVQPATYVIELIKDRWPDHPMASSNGPAFGVEFKNLVWPMLEERGAELVSQKPNRYQLS